MVKKVEKNPVGRPKLADPKLIKDSWCRIVASLVIAFAFAIGGISVLTFSNTSKIKGNVSSVKNSVEIKRIKVIPAKKTETRIINTDGTMTRIIPVE